MLRLNDEIETWGYRPIHGEPGATAPSTERCAAWGTTKSPTQSVGAFEPNQVVKARERLGAQGLGIRMVPGGHLTTLEQPEHLARIIEEVGPG